MSLRRFIVPPDAITADAVVLRGSESHHAAVVLRMQPGERVVVVDGSGLERVVELTSVSADATTGRVLETKPIVPARVELLLIQGIPKAAKMDDVVRMGTELGVREFIPVLTRRTVAEGRGRAARWRRIGAAAAKQSRRADVPAVHDPEPFAEALDRLPPDTLVLVLWEGERARSIGSVLRRGPRPERVAVVVGPEGGLDEDEVRLAVERGGVPVTVGPLILRTETAGVAALAMVLYEFELTE